MTDRAIHVDHAPARPSRTFRHAVLAAVALAVLMAVPIPGALAAGAGTSPASTSAAVTAPSATPAGAPVSAGLGHGVSAASSSIDFLSAPVHLLTGAAARAAAFGSSALSAPSSGGQLLPRPASLSGNTYLNAPCSTTSTLTAVNGTNHTLLAALASEYLLFNVSGDTFCTGTTTVSPQFSQSGYLEMERSNNSGATWTPSWIPQNASWTNKSSPSNGSIPGFAYGLQGYGPGFDYPSVASADDGTTLVATMFGPSCLTLGTCTNATVVSPGGIAVASSTNGGTSWAKTAVLQEQSYLGFITPSAACQGSGFTVGFYPENVSYDPSVAINPVNHFAVVVWEQFALTWIFNTTTCGGMVNGIIMASYSSDGGLTWSTPKNISGPEGYDPRIAVGPAPHYNFTVDYQNWGNATNEGSNVFGVNYAVTETTNNGTSWSTPVDTSAAGTVNELWRGASQPDSFYVTDNPFPLLAPNPADLAIDTSPSSPHVGNSYIVWPDNQSQSASHAGVTVIDFQSERAGTTSWSAIQTLTAPTASTAYFQPSISVAPDGTVWVTFYGMSKSTGYLQMYALHSSNGGASWSSLSVITSATSVLPNGLYSIGLYGGNFATNTGDFATWMDCRSSSCGTSGNESVMITQVEPVNVVAANVSSVNLTVSSDGVTSSLATPGSVSWALGTSQTVSAPGWFLHNATTVASFSNYTGVVNSSSFTATFTYNGGSQLAVNYKYVPAAYIAGTFSPNTTFSRLTVDGINVPLHGVSANLMAYNFSVASGRLYYLNASASAEYTKVTNHQVAVSSGNVTTYNIVLGKTIGWITGKLSPLTANVTINGSVLPAANVSGTTGTYNISEPWGSYWVNATGTGVTSSNQYLTVLPGQSTTDSIQLIGGWIKGTLASNYPGVKVRIDNVTVTNFLGVSFNDSYLGGVHELIATAPGYNTSYENLTVTPAKTAFAIVTLTNTGSIAGSVGPVGALGTATLVINNVTNNLGGPFPITAATGDFLVTLKGEINYTVTVRATNFSTFTATVFVRPGHVTTMPQITLSPTSCTTNCNHNPGGGNHNNSTPSSGLSPLLIGGIIVAVVLVAAIAAVVVMRRRSSAGGSMEESQYAPEPGTTDPGTEGTDASGGSTYGGPPPPGAQ